MGLDPYAVPVVIGQHVVVERDVALTLKQGLTNKVLNQQVPINFVGIRYSLPNKWEVADE